MYRQIQEFKPSHKPTVKKEKKFTRVQSENTSDVCSLETVPGTNMQWLSGTDTL